MLATVFAVISALVISGASASTVFAHFMVQYSYAYDVDQWKTDIKAAQQVGIDGFALNWIPPDCQQGLDWMVDRIDDAFTAAEQMGFKLMYSFDMGSTQCNIYWNQTFMQDMISKYAGNQATYRWNTNILVSTYGGDQVEQYGNDFFQVLKNNMAHSHAITLAPALTTFSMAAQTSPQNAASDLVQQYPSIDGFLNWQAWPFDVFANITAAPDQALQSALKKAGKTGPYIMAVSPWQFKDLNDGNPLNSWVAYSDTLFSHRFEQLTSKELEPDIIELLTWNDFSESHYLRDLPPQNNQSATDYVELGDMGNYAWGQDHAPWRIIAKYYIAWWKTGAPPKAIEDQVVYWYRVHPKGAICSGGSSTAVRNSQFPVDAVFAWALVKNAVTVSMSLGDNQYWSFEAKPGKPTTGFVPFPSNLPESGVTPQVAIMRNRALTHISTGSKPVSNACSWQNYNPVVHLAGPGINV